MRKKLPRQQKTSLDNKLLVLSLILAVVGLVAIADASAPLAEREFSDRFFFVKQQASWALIGVFFLFLFMKVKYTFWEKVAKLLFALNLVLLLAVFIPGVGTELLGAKRWIFIGPISIQPSEFLKLTMAAYLAKVASKDGKTAAYLVPIIIASILIMLQPDLGTTIVLVGMGFTQLFVSGVGLLTIFLSGIFGSLAVIFAIITSPYRKERLLTFLEATRDPLGSSYHIRQILLALGSGGLFGVGLGQSRQKYLFLPETATDSIFAVIAEEVGFVGTSILIAAFAYLVIRGVKIAKKAPDKFSQIMAVGVITWIGGQALLNIGSMVALVPLTGIPLPFISYGGSSLVATLAGIGVLLNISKHAKE